jgi:hypothetical protein
VDKYDYAYELSDEQLLRYSSLPPIAKLTWLDQARRFTLLARRNPARDPKPVRRIKRR